MGHHCATVVVEKLDFFSFTTRVIIVYGSENDKQRVLFI